MSELPPEGWYDDPQAPGMQRLWDGAGWTHETREVPPPEMPPPTMAPPAALAAPAAPAPPTADDQGSGGIRGKWRGVQAKADAHAARLTGIDNQSSFSISEDGKNGKISFDEAGLQREIKRSLGKDDRQFIPYKSIQFVEHNRKSMGRDVVAVQVGSKTFEWKIATDAEGFVDRLNHILATS